MRNSEHRRALRRLRRGDPTHIIQLYTQQIEVLKDEYTRVGCKSCNKGLYARKIQKYEDEIKKIKAEKRFMTFNFNEALMKKD